MHAEEHYQFRHAIMRDVAYSLHTPALRGTLHRVALEQYESQLEVEIPEPAEKLRTEPMDIDPLMAQLATHARYAQDEPYANLDLLRRREARYLARAGMYAERHYDHTQAVAIWRRLAEVAEGQIRFWALQRASHVCRLLSLLDEGLVIAERAVEIARRECSNHELVLALTERGITFWFKDEPELARACLEEAVGLHGPDVSKSLEANSLGMLGMVYGQLGRSEESEQLALKALALLREDGDRHNEGVLLQNLGAMMMDSLRLDDAERYLHQAIALHEEIGDDTNLGIGLNNLAMLEIHRGNLKQSIEHANAAIPLLTKVGSRRSLGYSYAARGNALTRMGALAEARKDTLEALAIHREAGNGAATASCLCDLGVIELLDGNPDEGREVWLRGLADIRRFRADEGVKMYVKEMREACAKAGVEPFE